MDNQESLRLSLSLWEYALHKIKRLQHNPIAIIIGIIGSIVSIVYFIYWILGKA